MAQIYVTGPVNLWVKRISDAQPRFLGHGERAPTVQFSPIWVDVHCDVGGAAVFDRIYSGESARISVDLVRFNNNVLMDIQARAKSAAVPGAEFGYDPPGAIGSLCNSDQIGYTVYMDFVGAKRPTMQNAANGALHPGWRFFNCTMDPESIQGGSANPYKVHLSWTAVRMFNPAVNNAFGFGSFTLFDGNMGELNGRAIN